MAYKRYVKKKGKTFGPYYYESYRDASGVVRKKYIGTEDPGKSARKKIVPTNKERFLFLGFLLLSFVLAGALVTFEGSSLSALDSDVISPISENMVPGFSGFLISDSESVVETFDGDEIDLEVRRAPISTKNRNKRMDFDLQGSGMRLYFDLLNYSGYIDGVVDANERRLKGLQTADEKSAEGRQIADERRATGLDASEEKREIARGAPESAGNKPSFLTGEVVKGVEKKAENSVGEIKVNSGKISEGEVLQNNRENRDIPSAVDRPVKKSLTGAVVKTIAPEIAILEGEEIEVIEDSIIFESVSFDINVEKTAEDEYKWGYDVRLNDLKFMARIEITSEDEIVVKSPTSVRVGRALLSFADLEREGYTVRLEKPILGLDGDIDFTFDEEEEEGDEPSDRGSSGSAVGGRETGAEKSANKSQAEGNQSQAGGNQSQGAGNQSQAGGNQSTGRPSSNPSGKPLTGGAISEESTEESSPSENSNAPTNKGKSDAFTEEPTTITGKIISDFWRFTGKIVGLTDTGNFNDITYENSLMVYIERDFRGTKYEVGDLITLDPTLVYIELDNAEHLDSDRNFISNIYDYVKVKDDNWSEVIYPGEYVRATFEEFLDNSNDITIHARSVNGTAGVEVYEVNDARLIARFDNISDAKTQQILLTNLSVSSEYSQNIFDLKIIDSAVEFDWIIDPTAYDGSNNIYRCGYIDQPGYYQFNQSITISGDDCIWVNSSDVIIDGQDFTLTGDKTAGYHAIKFEGGLGTELSNNSVHNLNFWGWDAAVYLWYADGGYYYNLNATGSRLYSYFLFRSDNNVFDNINATGNDFYGMQPGNIVANITISNGVFHNNGLAGLWLENFENSLAINNTISDNGDIGINLQDINSNGNITRNNISGHTYDLDGDDGGTGFLIWDNILATQRIGLGDLNTMNVPYDCTGEKNIIGGDCMGGNYWMNYGGYDSDADGIGDQGLVMDHAQIDHYPLVDANNNETDGLIKGCLELWQSGSYYMGSDVGRVWPVIGTCMVISNNSVSLNLMGNTVSGIGASSNRYGIYSNGADLTRDNNTVMNGTFENATSNIYMINNHNLTLDNLVLNYGSISTRIDASQDCNVKNTVIKHGTFRGLSIDKNYDCNFNNLTIYDFAGTNWVGIYADDSMGSTFSNLNLSDNYYGFWSKDNEGGTIFFVNSSSTYSKYGLYIDRTSDSVFSNLTLDHNEWGVRFSEFTASEDNIINVSYIRNNSVYGIDVIQLSFNNLIYDNFFNNTNNAFVSTGDDNKWNTTYDCTNANLLGGTCTGGNYWGYPNGTGHSNTCFDANADGICDSTFTIDSGNIDYLPILFPAPVVTITSPYNGSAYNSTDSISLNYTSASPTGVDTCWYSLNGDINISMDGCGSTTIGPTVGENSLTVYSNDTASLTGSKTHIFYVDTGFPTASFVNPTSASIIQKANYTFVNVSSSDTLTNISSMINFDNSLVSWWRMDDLNSTGGVVDYMGRNNMSINGNAIQSQSGKFGRSFSFDGDTDYLETNMGDVAFETGTISAWIKSSRSGTPEIIIEGSGGSNPSVEGGNDGYYYLLVNNSCQTIFSNIVVGEWMHYVATWNGTESRVYNNGTLVGTQACTYYPDSVGTFTLGDRTGGVQGFSGGLDDVMIFNRSLSEAEIAALHTSTSPSHSSVNMTLLPDKYYPIQAYAQDSAGNVDATSLYSVIIDGTNPLIEYGTGTDTSAITSNDFVFVNVSSSDTLTNISTIINYDNSILAWWRMDDLNSTHVLDYMGLKNATISGDATQVDGGKIGKGFSFDGDEDYLRTPAISSGTNFAISTWIKTANTANYVAHHIASTTSDSGVQGFRISYQDFLTHDRINLALNGVDNYTITTSDACYAQWCHLLINYQDNGTVEVYLNSNLTGSPTFGSGAYIGTTINIGQSIDGNGEYLNGSMDDLIIFNKTLTFAEIQALYSNQTQDYVSVNSTATEGYVSFNAYTQDLAGNVNSTANQTILVDFFNPRYSIDSPSNNSFTSNDFLDFGLSLNETNFKNITYTLSYGGVVVNQTSYSTAVSSINWTLANGDGIYIYNMTMFDLAGKSNTTGNLHHTRDTVAPQVTLNPTGMPTEGSVGGSSVTYNWTVFDNIDTNISCNPVSSTGEGNAVNASNDSTQAISTTLAGGAHNLSVICYDNAANSNTTALNISYIVAEVNITSPANWTIFRLSDTTSFIVEELEGKTYLDNVTIMARNNAEEWSQTYLTPSGDTHTGNYAWPSKEPSYVNISAVGFNNAIGIAQNTTDIIQGIFLRASGNTTAPRGLYSCPNETYVINGADINISANADLDTLILSEEVSVLDPLGVTYVLASENLIRDNGTYWNQFNYSFNVNNTGEYIISTNFTDYEGQSITSSYIFNSMAGFNVYRINTSTATNITQVKQCNGEILDGSADFTVKIATGAVIDLNVSIIDDLHNLTLFLNDVNLTGNVSEAVGYKKMSNETDPPTGERRMALFEVNSTLNFTNYSLTYDYTEIAHTVNNESSIKMYKCSNISSCDFNEIVGTVDIGLNTITSWATNLSYFMITESGTTTNTVTNTVTQTSSSTSVVYRDLNILTPGDVALGLKDQIVVPIILNNPESIDLLNIRMNATSTTTDIDPVFETGKVDRLGAGKNITLMLFLESHSLPGDYEIHIEATVDSPKFAETTVLYVKLVEAIGLERVVERIVLAQDLFRENPQCLELNDLLIEAQRMIDNGEIEKAREIVQETIYKCKELVTSDEYPFSFGAVSEWRTPLVVVAVLIIISLIVAIFLRKPKFDLYRSKEKKRKWYQFWKKSKK